MSLSAFRSAASSQPRESFRFDSPDMSSSSNNNNHGKMNENKTGSSIDNDKRRNSSADHHDQTVLDSKTNESLVSANKMLLEKMKQQEQRLQQYKHYEKYLQTSPRGSSPASYSNPNDVSLYSNLDELLKDFKREMSTVRTSLEASSNISTLEELEKRSPSLLYNADSVTMRNNDRDHSYFFRNDTAAKEYLSSNTEGMLKDLDFSIDRSSMKPFGNFDEDPTSPIQKRLVSDSPMKGVSPSPFTRLKQADTRDFLMSPIITHKAKGSMITQPTNKGGISNKETNQEMSSKNQQTRADHLLFDMDDTININTSSHISSSAEAALKLENIQLRNEISKLSSSVVAMQTRMKDLESSVDQILQLVLSTKK